MQQVSEKLAIILFNLGGPRDLQGVEKFLYSLFSDPDILRLPSFLRLPIAKFISLTREKKAKNIYTKIGGKSPILEETIEQQKALENILKLQHLSGDFKIFICMRHAEPKSIKVIKDLNQYQPDKIMLLPLYPHFSVTTTGSSLKDFMQNYQKISIGKKAEIKQICCYPKHKKFIETHVNLIMEAINKLKTRENFRLLFSAHSLPEKIIKAGDPYEWQTEQTVTSIVRMLGIKDLDYELCYQSKVGPIKWLTPATDDEIIKAGEEKKSLVLVPISFVSEHVETLVELDIDYKAIADKYNIEYIRVPALGTHPLFIKLLNDLITENLKFEKQPTCPTNFKFCPCLKY